MFADREIWVIKIIEIQARLQKVLLQAVDTLEMSKRNNFLTWWEVIKSKLIFVNFRVSIVCRLSDFAWPRFHPWLTSFEGKSIHQLKGRFTAFVVHTFLVLKACGGDSLEA